MVPLLVARKPPSRRLLHRRQVMYQFSHGKPMSCVAMAQLLSNTLYYKRFFPYYTFNICAGLDSEGAPSQGLGRGAGSPAEAAAAPPQARGRCSRMMRWGRTSARGTPARGLDRSVSPPDPRPAAAPPRAAAAGCASRFCVQ